jgi:hypothetical protein
VNVCRERTMEMKITPKAEIEKILAGDSPSRFVYAPNYWQWFRHQVSHNQLPDEIRHCNTLLDLYNYLGVDIFSRNIYSDPEKYWFGGLCDEVLDDFEIFERKTLSGKNKIISREYRSPGGILDEKLTYIFNESTLVQTQFLINDYVKDFELFRHFVADRRWEFNSEKFNNVKRSAGEKGIVIAGEFFSPLKMLHITMGPVNSVYFLMEYPAKAREVVELHEAAQLRCIEQTVKSGAVAVMSMDNLDTMFHPPGYVEEYCSAYYRKASEICHSNGAKFFIHACGQQKDNLKLISSYGVDGLEGVASPPLGDVMLDDAMKATRDDFIITGGISAMEIRDLSSRDDIFKYVEQLFTKMLPFKKRFIFSSSCNTSIDTTWETIKNFRDAWLEFSEMS